MEKNQSIYKDAVSFIEAALVKLPEDTLDGYTKNLKGLKEASGMAKDEEAWAYLAFASVREASAVAFKLFRLRELVDDLADKYYALPTPEEAVVAAKKYNDEHQKEAEELTKAQQKFSEKASERDLFMAVCAGTPLKEAKQKQESYKKQMQASMGA